MKDIKVFSKRVMIALFTSMLSCTIAGCVVTPKKVASFDTKCMAYTNKIELTTEQIGLLDEVDCLTKSCRTEVAAALVTSTIATTASTIVSGSIALIGNTFYWVESQGRCSNPNSPAQPSPDSKPVEIDKEYLLHEEIITAKS
jgi:hypothetical protein